MPGHLDTLHLRTVFICVVAGILISVRRYVIQVLYTIIIAIHNSILSLNEHATLKCFFFQKHMIYTVSDFYDDMSAGQGDIYLYIC